MSNKSELDTLSKDIETWMFKGDIMFAANINVTVKLRDILLDPRKSLSDIACFINSDPVLASRVIALANSAAYGTVKKVSVREAVSVIGSSALNFLAFSIIQKQMVKAVSGRGKVILERLWAYSLEVACTACAYSKVRSPKTSVPDTAMFLGMLLHLDIMFIVYSASRFDQVFDDLESLAVTVRKISGRIHKKLMDMYHVPPAITDQIKTAYVPFNFDIAPTTDAEILAFAAQSVVPHDVIKALIPKVLDVRPITDEEVIEVRDRLREALLP